MTTEPAANALLLGHAGREAILLRALATGRLPHAWLFRGPQGVGKATLAYRFARRLLAGADHEAAATDSRHYVFRMVAGGHHPDLQVLERIPNRSGKLAKEIVVDQVREVDERLHETASRDGYKVLLVDAADELNTNAANSLLKLLEEPPPRTAILLVVQRPGLLPRTILSRCAQLSLAPLTRAEVLKGLSVLLPDLAPERAELLADLAEGSIGRAVAMETGGWPEAYAALLQRLVMAKDSEAARLACALQLAQDAAGTGFQATADLLGWTLRRLARTAAGRGPRHELFDGERQALQALAQGRGLDHWVGLWDKLRVQAARVDSLNLDPQLALVQLVQGFGGDLPEPQLGIG